MKITVTAVLYFRTLIALSHAEDPEFTPVELAEAKGRFARADQKLNETYRAAESKLDEDPFASLREEQRDWLRTRDAIAEFSILQNGRARYEGKSEESIHYWHNLAFRSELRTQMIQAWTEFDETHAWDGYWTDGNGAELLIQRNPNTDTFSFSVSAIFGRSLRSEGLDGAAKINENMAFCAYDSDYNGEGWIVFWKQEETPRLEIIPSSHDPGRYCGDPFTRIRDLSEKERSAPCIRGFANEPEMFQCRNRMVDRLPRPPSIHKPT